jgi:hypothetical protein
LDAARSRQTVVAWVEKPAIELRKKATAAKHANFYLYGWGFDLEVLPYQYHENLADKRGISRSRELARSALTGRRRLFGWVQKANALKSVSSWWPAFEMGILWMTSALPYLNPVTQSVIHQLVLY